MRGYYWPRSSAFYFCDLRISLGVAFGKQTSEERLDENAILDRFARVENIPNEEYSNHFDQLDLGPNVAVRVNGAIAL
jgi:hypothetical protein